MATATELKTIFPVFAAVEDATAEYWLTRAARVVDAEWPEDDRDHAQMILTAHLLTLQGLGTGAEAQAAAAGASGFKTMRSGALTLERFGESGEGGYDATSYGKQFKALLRLIKGGPRVTGTGYVDGLSGGYRDRPIPGW